MVMNNPANNNNNNPVAASASALALAPPPHPPQPHRPSTSCDRHPDERFTGFCPSCLFDRLSGLDITTGKNISIASSSRKPPSSSAALKAIFRPSSSSSGLLFQELRRTKSFSATKAEALTLGAFEPQRRSCDVRVRNTLWSLFHEDVEHNDSQTKEGLSEINLENINSVIKSPLFEDETEIEIVKDITCGNLKEPRSVIDEIVEEEEEEEEIEEEEIEKVKDFEMEFNPQTTKKPNRDFKEIAGSFWSAASVFSKKLQKWRQRQKLKKHRTGNLGAGSAALPVEKSIGRQLRDTQSEIAEYGYGRRSCDTDPRFSIDAGRFSLDAGRVSVDDPRYSFDEPRASWDGYFIGRTGAPPRMTSMLSVVEDSPVRNHVLRSDTHIPVEKPPPSPSLVPGHVVDEIVPGGSAQTREYYFDSSSRRRKSLDRCSSTRKLSASVVAEIDEMKLSASNAKDSISHSLRDDCSVENSEMGVRENVGTMECNKKGTKKSRWSWNIFGLLHRKNGNKFEEQEGRSGVDRTFSGSWNVETRKGFDPKMIRSNSSVSWRSSGTNGGGFQRNSVDGYASGKKKVSKIENEMFKFYLTQSKGRRRGSSNSTASTNRPVPASQPFGSRNVMNFY
ncbi:hypothetical protein CARUB_v10022830mg [Capsella rubella]|uniref:Uncharacterized protein n=1 Tax=Capsella rubella TaxID=81985 RepID=R0HBE4_9BRAS|nr:UPF0503 protein At3g09070, chloroplastic [Capsella rubella]EOA26744.1 hypothetical protein CARUB_v10022830mg [Capsella rubella]